MFIQKVKEFEHEKARIKKIQNNKIKKDLTIFIIWYICMMIMISYLMIQWILLLTQ